LIYIWVRRTLDWAHATHEAIVPSMQPKVHVWDATFNIPYHAFRDRVAQIAELNHSRVEGAIRAGWDEIPDGALVLPVDDDDWFAPHAASVLDRAIDPEVTSFVWASSWIELPISPRHHFWLMRRRLGLPAPHGWTCTTNNYALVKGAGEKTVFRDHRAASRSFKARLKAADRTVKQLDARLSVTNRTLASMTALQPRRRTITRSLLIRKFRRYKRLYDEPLPPELGWCRPYVSMMSELMSGLETLR
jgi:hypothetical protein